MIDEKQALQQERATLYETVRDLSPAEWDVGSLCDGWRIRDVVAHVNLGVTLTVPAVVAGLLLARGDFDRFMKRYSIKKGSRPIAELLAETELVARSSHNPPTTKRVDLAIDTAVHHHDVAIPLGRTVPTDDARLRWMADGMVGANKAIGSAQQSRGLRLIATDIDWHYGTGPEVRGPAMALICAASGRSALDDHLEGDGLVTLQERRR
jgi:uncharacterized protein (TIGR03083 family)